MNDQEKIRLVLLDISEQEKYLYETLRPTREVDARVIMVSLTAISLITTSLTSGEKIRFNTGTTDILLSNWLYLGVPLMVVLLYWMWDLISVWKLTQIRIAHAMDSHFKAIEQLEKYKDKYRHNLNKVMFPEPVNDDLSKWYEGLLSILDTIRPFDEKEADLLLKTKNAFDIEYKRKRMELDGEDNDDKDKIEQSMSDELDDLYSNINEAFDKYDFLWKDYKKREILSVSIPIILASFALLIFLVKLFFPHLL